jgi:hypothetical protein
VEQKRNRTTLSQAMGLAKRGYRRPTGAACAPRHEGAGGADVALPVSGCCLQRRARAAWYSCSRARRPRNVPRCGPTSQPAHGTPAGRTGELAKKFLLRDHAPPQSQAASALVAKKGCADGVGVRPRHAVIWRPRPGAAWPAASPPANAAPTAGIRDLGSNADSNAEVGTCVHSLCAGRLASAVVGNGSLAYHDDGPREHVPKGQPGANALTFSSGAYRNREANLYFCA